MSDRRLDEILRAARSVVVNEDEAAPGPPPGWAHSVVHRWRGSPEREASESWLVVSRRGLAVAFCLMLASLAWHARVSRVPVLMESTASETVVLSVYPQ